MTIKGIKWSAEQTKAAEAAFEKLRRQLERDEEQWHRRAQWDFAGAGLRPGMIAERKWTRTFAAINDIGAHMFGSEWSRDLDEWRHYFTLADSTLTETRARLHESTSRPEPTNVGFGCLYLLPEAKGRWIIHKVPEQYNLEPEDFLDEARIRDWRTAMQDAAAKRLTAAVSAFLDGSAEDEVRTIAESRVTRRRYPIEGWAWRTGHVRANLRSGIATFPLEGEAGWPPKPLPQERAFCDFGKPIRTHEDYALWVDRDSLVRFIGTLPRLRESGDVSPRIEGTGAPNMKRHSREIKAFLESARRRGVNIDALTADDLPAHIHEMSDRSTLRRTLNRYRRTIQQQARAAKRG